MVVFRVSELTEGMRFTMPVYVDDHNILVSPGVPLKAKEIERLKKWDVQTVKTEGKLMVDAPAQPSAGSATPASANAGGAARVFFEQLQSPSQQEILKLYGKLTKQLEIIHKKIKDEDIPDSSEIDHIVDALLAQLNKNRSDLIQFILLEGGQASSPFLANSINCTVLSLIIGSELGIQQFKLLQLGTGALLHDIGMLRMPDQILSNTGKLSDEELTTIRSHTAHSYRIITKELRYSEEIGLIALQHHERWDGEGYPNRLAGKKINLASRIVSVADAFEAMVSHRPYRDPLSGYFAMKSILSDNGRRFDPEILRTFLRSMGIYPVGSFVLLSNGAVARVDENIPDTPIRPKVRILISDKGQVELDSRVILDLSQEKSLHIVKAIEPGQYLNKTAPSS